MADPLELENTARQTEAIVALLPPKVRSKARAILNQRGTKRVQLLNQLISKEHRKRRMRAKATALPGALLLLASLAAALRLHTFGGYIAALGLSGLTLLALSAMTLLPSRLEKAAKEALLESEEPESIGPLLESLHTLVPAARAQARENLIRALPHLTPEAFQKLTPAQRSQLYGTLNFGQHNTDSALPLSVLTVLREAGDKSCLGVVYMLAAGKAATHTELAVREAARECLEHLFVRLDFGPLEDLPHSIDGIGVHLREEKTDFQDYALCLLTLTRLLPQVTPANYRHLLSAGQRTHLYDLLLLYAAAGSGMYRYRRRELHFEIVHAAERLGDTHAIDALQEFAGAHMATSDEELYTSVCRVIDTLEALPERKHD
jgi:hypothetical protein